MSIIVAILIFGFIVFIHELGHYLFARKAGILVKEFALGMGPKLISKKKGETLYSIRILPLGGFCSMLGEDEKVEGDERAFSNKTVWERFQVIFAGPLFNFILALILAILYIGLTGTVSTTVGGLVEDSPAAKVGILPGDQLVRYNEKHIIAQKELSLYINAEKPTSFDLTIKRGDTYHVFKLEPEKNEDGMYRVGLYFDVINLKNPLQIVKYGIIEVAFWLRTVVYSLGLLISGSIARENISGPVGIVGAISSGYKESVQYGIKSVIATISFYIVLLSANLGVMNLLPIPALDGGRLIFIAIEAVRKKPMDPDKEGLIHFVGFVLLMGLMVFLFYNDLVNAVGNFF